MRNNIFNTLSDRGFLKLSVGTNLLGNRYPLTPLMLLFLLFVYVSPTSANVCTSVELSGDGSKAICNISDVGAVSIVAEQLGAASLGIDSGSIASTYSFGMCYVTIETSCTTGNDAISAVFGPNATPVGDKVFGRIFNQGTNTEVGRWSAIYAAIGIPNGTFESVQIEGVFASNATPTDITLANNTLGDSAATANATVGGLTATDSDDTSHTFSLVTDSGACGASGDDNNSSFAIDGSNLDVGTSALTVGTYNVCVQAADDDSASLQESFAITITDSTAPAFENGKPSTSGTTDTQTTVAVDIDEAGTVFAMVVPDGTSAPSSADVIAGRYEANCPAVASGNISLSSGDFTGTIDLTGLSASTAYDIYVVSRDDESTPNLQSGPTLLEITTAAPNSVPTATITAAPDVSAAGGTTYVVTVSYSDTDGTIGASSIGTDDLVISGLTLASFNIDSGSGSATTVVSYTFTPPGGAWDSNDNTSYTIALGSGAVTDDDADAVASLAGGTPGTSFVVNAPGPDATATAGTISVPVDLVTTLFGSSSATNVFDFVVENPSGDGGGFQMDSVVLNLSGTASANFTRLRFSLSGCGTANDVAPAAATNPTTVTFSSLAFSVNDNSSQTCTVSAYWADNSGITDNQTVAISMDADTDITTSNATDAGGFASTSPVTSGDMSTEVKATRLVFGQQPNNITNNID